MKVRIANKITANHHLRRGLHYKVSTCLNAHTVWLERGNGLYAEWLMRGCVLGDLIDFNIRAHMSIEKMAKAFKDFSWAAVTMRNTLAFAFLPDTHHEPVVLDESSAHPLGYMRQL